ncbi:MAG TPA: Flp pilus assembly protein CpaB [Nevskiaceae bacterium]|nr:Flp pilus assembly protein CpaB [Nevskiaceae bacterium]
MSSSVIKTIAVVAVILTVLLALLGYQVSRRYAEQAQAAEEAARRQAEAPKTLAVVALRPLAAYKPVERDAVALVEVAIAPKQYFTNVDDVVGKRPLVDIDGGAPLTSRYFQDLNILVRSIPPGFQAVSVEVSDVVGVGGFVRPGDIVDVLLYLRAGGAQPQARVLLRNLRVLAYQEQIIDRPEGLTEAEQAAGRDSNKRNRTAVLAVREADTTRLMLGASSGELRLALHGQSGEDQLAAADSLTPGGLPLNPEAKAAVEAGKVPDQTITLEELARVAPPPAEKKPPPPPPVVIHRGAEVQSVTP